MYIFVNSLAYAPDLMDMLSSMPALEPSFISHDEFIKAVGKGPETSFAGQVLIDVGFGGTTKDFNIPGIDNRVKKWIAHLITEHHAVIKRPLGDGVRDVNPLLAFAGNDNVKFPKIFFRAEFDEVSDAEYVIETLVAGGATSEAALTVRPLLVHTRHCKDSILTPS